MEADAERTLREFEERIRERELAEKRRVAPGWLDSDARLLEPERRGQPASGEGAKEEEEEESKQRPEGEGGPSEMGTDQGAELDRVFGGLRV